MATVTGDNQSSTVTCPLYYNFAIFIDFLVILQICRKYTSNYCNRQAFEAFYPNITVILLFSFHLKLTGHIHFVYVQWLPKCE